MGGLRFLNFLKNFFISLQENSKKCRICGIEGQNTGALDTIEGKEGPARGDQEEGSQEGQEALVLLPWLGGAAPQGAVPPLRFLRRAGERRRGKL